jgi:hypothetical protein
MTTRIDPREAKLPKWAQELIADMRRDLISSQKFAASLRTNHAGSNTQVQNYSHGDWGVPNNSRIAFHLLPDTGRVRRSVKVYIEDGKLMIQGDYSLNIHPESSNTFRVEFRERW